MERSTWRVVTAALKKLPRRCSRGQQYSSKAVLAVLLWAALHDRSILWACRRHHWPVQAWRRRLPDQSTMSRRLREPEILADLSTLLEIIQDRFDPGNVDDGDASLVRVDGKPLAINMYSADPDARKGWGAGEVQRGYKFHGLVANAKKLLGYDVEPMNTPEAEVAERLLDDAARRGRLPQAAVVLADASYDTNPLHAAARRCGARLLGPRRRPDQGISKSHEQDPGRMLSLLLMEADPVLAHWQRSERTPVEHYFAGLTAAGLHTLPPWVRTLTRVRVWVGAKVVLNAARLARLENQVA